MKLEDVLLTTTEILNLIQNATHEELFSEGLMYDKMHKAQCLKLLEWLGQQCNLQSHNDDVIEECERYHCHFCMSEIERLLKESK